MVAQRDGGDTQTKGEGRIKGGGGGGQPLLPSCQAAGSAAAGAPTRVQAGQALPLHPGTHLLIVGLRLCLHIWSRVRRMLLI